MGYCAAHPADVEPRSCRCSRDPSTRRCIGLSNRAGSTPPWEANTDTGRRVKVYALTRAGRAQYARELESVGSPVIGGQRWWSEPSEAWRRDLLHARMGHREAAAAIADRRCRHVEGRARRGTACTSGRAGRGPGGDGQECPTRRGREALRAFGGVERTTRSRSETRGAPGRSTTRGRTCATDIRSLCQDTNLHRCRPR